MPDSAERRACLAVNRQLAGRFAEAATEFEAGAGMLKPGDPTIDRMLAAAGNMWIAAGQPGKAAVAIDKALAGTGLLAEQHDVALVGGDTVRGPLVVTVQVAGWVEEDRWLTRSGARPGDLVMVSGIPGEAAAGLHVIQQHMPLNETTAQLQWRFLRPRPRIALGRQLRTEASAAMDVSDGLLTDLQKLCAASRCGALLSIDALPPSPAMQELFDADTALDEAYRFIEEHDAERVPVVDDGRLVGVLSRAVLQRRLAEDEGPPPEPDEE